VTFFLRELFLFFWRDLQIARSYRSPLVLEAIQALFGTAMFYYIARFVDSPELRANLKRRDPSLGDDPVAIFARARELKDSF